MNFKFKKGDQVRVTFGPTFGDPNAPTMFYYKITARKSKGMSGGPEYRLGSLSGWWAEHNLVLASQPTKNSPDCNEVKRAITYTPKETKCDTEDSGAFWDFSVPGYAKCSNCERSFEALPTVFMFKENNKFCRMCGKAMEVKE